MPGKTTPRLLFDVTGLIQWYGFFNQPSGIQRVTERLLNSRPIRSYPGLTCVARAWGGQGFFEVNAATVLDLCKLETRPSGIARIRAHLAQSVRLSTIRGHLSDIRPFHLPYVVTGAAHAEALIEAYFLRSPPKGVPRLLPCENISEEDVFFIPGDYWSHKTYTRAVRDTKQSTRMRLAFLVHDLFAIETPEWSHPVFGLRMKEQFELIAPEVEHCSQHLHT